jgi:flagellar basal-body rod modification protein FlgD
MSTVNPATPASATTGTGTGTGSTSTNATQQLAGNFDTFLQLLTTQLKNQDPTSPMDTNQFTQQLVEYSQVEQQIDTNTNLQTLISQGSSQNAAYATSYLGKTVTVSGGKGALASGQANWNYNLGAQASSAVLSITNSSGQTVWTGSGPTAQGANSFSWNGQDNAGNQLPDGTYTLNVAAADSSGSAITSTVTSSGQVSEVDMSSGTPQLVIGGMEVGLSGIASVIN